MRALAYLEWCYARHNARAILRSPARIVLWCFWIGSLAVFGLLRFSRSQSHLSQPASSLGHGAAIAFVGAIFFFSGFAIAAAAAGGRTATFRSPAEATLLSNAGLKPRTIALWLELRKIAGGWRRSLGGFLYAFLVFVPSHAGPLAMARGCLATVLILGIPQSAGLPAFLAARGRAKAPVIAFGSLLAAVGVAYAAAGASGARLWQPLVNATHFDPARVVTAALDARPLAFAVPLLVFATFALIVAWRGNDTLPELYAAGHTPGRLARLAGGRRRGREPVTTTRHRERVPLGAGALLWKDWIVIRRHRGAFRLWIAGGLAWIVCGAAAAAASRQLGDPTALITFAITIGLVILFWAPFSAATGLADDLAKPLFWLSTASLRMRLVVWTFARAWRGGLAVGCGTGAALLVLGHPLFAAASVPFACLGYWSLVALGIGSYAVFPSPLDARGPTALLRFVASLAYLVPAALLSVIAGAAHLGTLGATTAFVCGLALQGWLVIELVALRFAEYGASLATISRAK